CTVLTLAWLIPLLWLSGGPAAYIEQSRALGELAGGPTSVLSGTPGGVAQNLLLVVLGFVAGLGAALVLLLAPTPVRRTWPHSAARQLLLLWAAPALAVYLLGHTGQVGYVLFLLPAAILGVLFL